MAIVECPSCNQEFDLSDIELSVRKRETYECPYCHEKFSNWKLLRLSGDFRRKEVMIESQRLRASRSAQKSNSFLKSLENRADKKNFEFPLLVGNFKARWKRPRLGFTLFALFFIIFVHPFSALLFLLVIPIKILYKEFKRLKYSKEFAENILNPEYLRGSGLEIRSDLSCLLYTSPSPRD